MKPHAPRIETMTIPKEFIGAIIGPGGKIIQGMQEETGATITIEETDGVGRIELREQTRNVLTMLCALSRVSLLFPKSVKSM